MTLHDSDCLFRAATPADLDALERFAAASAVGVTTLPEDRAQLADRLARSAAAFASPDDASGEEIYLFVIEDGQGRVVGTSGIAARAGFHDRFYCYRNEMLVHASAALGASNRIHTLHLCHDLTGVTLLTSFYIEPEYEATLAPQLLSRARLLFIAEFAERFSDRIAVEHPGLADDAGRCPFWDAVGRRFFDMDYAQVERISGGRSKAFIAELLPQAPIYVPLLPEQAQWAIGQLHPVSEAPFAILMDEGFDADTYVDVFDGGPIVEARLAGVRSVAASRHRRWKPGDGSSGGAWQLVANRARGDFRALLCRARATATTLELPAAQAERLHLASADGVRSAPLPVAETAAEVRP
ncbi:MAG: arginine N-succinyltransferase [Rubrivivax sp.]|nr:arginine N-succinyltransferase [Rubrivivax sp.]